MSTEQQRRLLGLQTSWPSETGGCSVHTTLDVEGQTDLPGSPLWGQEATQITLILVTSPPSAAMGSCDGQLLRAGRPRVGWWPGWSWGSANNQPGPPQTTGHLNHDLLNQKIEPKPLVSKGC